MVRQGARPSSLRAYVGRAQGTRGYVKGWNHAKLLSIYAAGYLEVVWFDR